MLFASARSVAEATPDSRRGRTLRVAGPALMVLLGLLTGCGGRPFNVKPRPTVSKTNYRASGQINGVGVQAEPITDEDYLMEIFDANLIQAGVYPVRVRLTNNGSVAVELKKARFAIKSASGKLFRVTEPRKAYKRLISYYELSLYSKDGYKRSLADFGSYGLDTGAQLAPGDSRDGILFFLLPAEVASEGGLTLGAERFGTQAGTNGMLELRL